MKIRIKHHPRSFVEVYTDGRYQMFTPKKVANYRDALKIAAINMGVPAMLREAKGELKPGRYEVTLSDFKLGFKHQTFNIELNEVK